MQATFQPFKVEGDFLNQNSCLMAVFSTLESLRSRIESETGERGEIKWADIFYLKFEFWAFWVEGTLGEAKNDVVFGAAFTPHDSLTKWRVLAKRLYASEVVSTVRNLNGTCDLSMPEPCYFEGLEDDEVDNLVEFVRDLVKERGR